MQATDAGEDPGATGQNTASDAADPALEVSVEPGADSFAPDDSAPAADVPSDDFGPIEPDSGNASDVQLDLDAPVEPAPTLVAASAGPPPELTIEVMYQGEVSFAAGFGEEGALVMTPEGLVLVDEPGAEPVMLDALVGPISSTLAAGSAYLVFAETGIYLASEQGLVMSPLSGAFGDALPALGSAAGESGDLWFSGPGGVHIFRDGVLYPVAFADLDTANARLAWGPEYAGEPALWLGLNNAVFAVLESQDGLEAWPVKDELALEALEASLDGRVWTVSQGDIQRREIDGSWSWLRLPNAAADLDVSASGAEAWITTAQAIWFTANELWWPMLDGPMLDGVAAVDLDAKGRALLTDATGLRRATLGTIPDAPPVTWTTDVQVIADSVCGPCHGPGQNAHEMYSYAHWSAEIEDIVLVVSTGAMPLPLPNPAAFGKDEVDIIQDWLLDGLLE